MGHRLLIIDDDAGIQKMLKILLEFEHFEVMVASNGLVALEQLERASPDLILLDLMMPDMDGRMFLQELVRRGLRPSIPVIVLTADVYARPLVENMRVEGCFVKPFHLYELLNHIRQLLGEKRNQTLPDEKRKE